ncbi:MAG: glycosyltransferase, partial [Pricia sp.]
MKTICFFNSTKAWGGGEKWHLEACTHLHNQGHPVLAIAHLKSELYQRLRDTGVDCLGISIGNLSFLNPLKIKAVEKILRKNQVGTIVMNLSRDLKLAGLAAEQAGLKRIIYRRGSAIPIKNSFINRYYFKNLVTEVLANSQATKETVLEQNSELFPKDKIKVIYNGIDINEFLNKPVKPLYQKKDADEKDVEEIVLTNLGRLEFQKNQKFLIKLAAELKRRKLSFKILIGGDGRLKEELQTQAQELQVEQQVLFTG